MVVVAWLDRLLRGCERTYQKTGKIEDSDNLRAVGNALMLWPNKSR